MDVLYFVLTSFGMTQILVYGKVFDKIRPKHYFFHCSMCVGFHVGWILWSINTYTKLFTFDYSLITGFALACISSATSYVLNMVFGDEGINIKIRSNS